MAVRTHSTVDWIGRAAATLGLEEKAELFDRQIGEFVRDSARVYAIQDGDEPLVAVAYTGFEAPESPEEDLALWVRTTDAIVSTITLG